MRDFFASPRAKRCEIFVLFSPESSAEKSALSLGDPERADKKKYGKALWGNM